MFDYTTALIIGILGSAGGLTMFHFFINPMRETRERRRDEAKVEEWLRENTRDEPGRTHASTREISAGTSIEEERVRQICRSNQRIMNSGHEANRWSVWQSEEAVDPDSIMVF